MKMLKRIKELRNSAYCYGQWWKYMAIALWAAHAEEWKSR